MNKEKFNQTAYKNSYNKEHYKNIRLSIKKDDAEKILNYCKDINISQTQLFVKSVQYVIDNDLFDEILHK